MQYTKYGNFIKTWRSIHEAAIALNIKEPIINSIYDEKNEVLIGGFIWKKYSPRPKKKIQTKYYPILQFDSNRKFIKEWRCDWEDIVEYFGSKPPHRLTGQGTVVAWGYYWQEGSEINQKSHRILQPKKTTRKNKYKYTYQYVQYNTQKQIVQVWSSYKDIRAKYPKMTKTILDKACKNNSGEYCGYIWRKRKRIDKS